MRPCIGIDVGKRYLHLCLAEEERPAQRWRPQSIDLKEPDWDRQLAELVPDGSLIVAEPTGHHLLAPVATALRLHRPGCTIVIINNEMTGNVRRSHISRAKTDTIDARTLALAALNIASGDPNRAIRSARLWQPEASADVMTLRLLLHAYLRHTKVGTRCANRLRIFGHSIWPCLGQRLTTWSRCLAAGAIDPISIKAYAAAPPPNVDYRSWRYVEALARDLPNIDAHPALIDAIRETFADLCTGELLENRAFLLLTEHLSLSRFAETARLWSSIPCSAPQYIAALLVAANGNPAAMSLDQFKAAIGVVPVIKQSGDKKSEDDRRPGYRPAKSAIHIWSMALLHPDTDPNLIKTFHQQKQDFAATKAKLVKLLHYIARSGQPYRQETPA